MNDVLELKGHFDTRKNQSSGGRVLLPKGCTIRVSHLLSLRDELERVAARWKKGLDIGGALVRVHYAKVVAKSNRIGILLSEKGSPPSESIRGAAFVNSPDGTGKKHVFTHFVSFPALQNSIEYLGETASMMESFGGKVSSGDELQVSNFSRDSSFVLSPTNFLKVIRDAAFVENFDAEPSMTDLSAPGNSIVTLYRTGVDAGRLLESILGKKLPEDKFLSETTVLLDSEQLGKLCRAAPELVAMGVTDLREIPPVDEVSAGDGGSMAIPPPENEPVIGVIDTQFDENAYFHEWVESHNLLPKGIEIHAEDRRHGTAVCSIVVDGPKGNPSLDDGCGRFRVRHFGVATASRFSAFEIVKAIRKIVAENQDIKVWNLSLGSMVEIRPNFISPEAAELDALQKEFDVVFVVAGTNLPPHPIKIPMRIGAPADSLNSVVVNSVGFDGLPASYSRVGPVLSFFNKPDVSYYGGDGPRQSDCIVVNEGGPGARFRQGTSYAAPWIARKLAYMICKLGFSREVAKALLVDAAGGWNQMADPTRLGHGIVPRRISDVVGSDNAEIRFFLTGVSEEYETYTYALPVPAPNGSHPYFARATLVYFPSCDRNQGVDYTGTELDIHFGRVKWENGRRRIKSIDNNTQGDPDNPGTDESDAREIYRKWDNVKRISEIPKSAARPKKAYETRLWGISVKSKARNAAGKRDRLPFGIVVTLKEMRGVNRIDDFIQQCQARGWIVNRINVKSQVEIYNQGQMELPLE